MVDGQLLAFEQQGTINNQRDAFVDDFLVVTLHLAGKVDVAQHAFLDAFAQYFVQLQFDRFQITVVAALQHPFAITHIHGVWRTVKQCAHEFKLIAQGAFDRFALLDLSAHAGVPGQRYEQQQAGAQDDLENQVLVFVPIGIGLGAVASPA
ncbi:hypothetical protein D3C80_1407360 [compost metagenome]